MRIDILMATYNGEKYIKQQIDSILNQTYQEWRLLIRDDGSTDNTRDIILHYVQQYPEKIQIVHSGRQNIGVVRNFRELIKCADNSYVMFCDQDDIWKKNKIQDTILEMQDIERKNQKAPILIFSDLVVIDSGERVISESFVKRNNFQVENIQLARLVFWNVVVGNTILINEEMKKLMIEMPDDACMHDHWAVLTCLLNNGIVQYINKQTVLYRQHDENVVGDQYSSWFDKARRILSFSEWAWRIASSVQCYRKMEQQACILYEKYKFVMSDNDKKLLQKLINIWEYNVFKRIAIICRGGVLPNTIYLKVGMLLYFAFWGCN